MLRRVLSVVVEVRGASAASLSELVARVRAQKVSAEVEVVLVDLGAGVSDATRSLADAVVATGPKWSRAEAWNAGLAKARGEVLVLQSLAALPADPRWLFHLAAPFSDSTVAAVFARRLPRPGFMADAGDVRGRQLRFSSAAEFDALSPFARRQACAFSAESVALSRAAWAAQPFEPLDGAEGEAWARHQLRAGRTLVHSNLAAVFVESPRTSISSLVGAARAQRSLAQVLGPAPLALPAGVKARALPVPLALLAGSVWARVEAKLGRG